MGNEGSSVPSDSTTPNSEWQSVHSSMAGGSQSKRRSSASSTRLPTPTEPPEPDLTDLTEEEIRQIRAVIDRAKDMQFQEQQRIRELEQDYTQFALSVEQRAQSAEAEVKDVPLCPLCLKNEIPADGTGLRKGQNICVDCEKLTCQECGQFQGSLNSKEWVCIACQKRRKLVLSTGLWHPGIEPEAKIPLADIIQGLKSKNGSRSPGSSEGSRHSLERAPSDPETEASLRKKSTKQRSHSDPESESSVLGNEDIPMGPGIAQKTFVDEQSPEPRHLVPPEGKCPSSDGSRDSLALIDSPSSDVAPSTSGSQSRLRGVLMTMVGSCAMGHGVKSDSELSASDVDMEDVERSMHYYHDLDPLSTDEVSDDYSMMSIGSSDDGGFRRRKNRPHSLNIPRSHSATSSDDDTTDSAVSTDTESRLAPLAVMDEARVAQAASAFAEEMEDFKADESSLEDFKLGHKYDEDLLSDNELKVQNSPSPPRSPSWREGLESPPFSPKRKGSYPGKKRPSSPVSPKDSRMCFTYENDAAAGISTEDEMAVEEKSGHVSHGLQGATADSSSYHEDGVRASGGDYDDDRCTTNEPFLVKIPESKAIQNLHDVDTGKLPINDTSTVIDLATYAATIASNTANLTQMTVSPTNLEVLPIHERDRMSPDSQDTESTGSTSPISPGYYDNANEELEVELADPSSKPIDYQGTKRQKARPPSTDWSPVIDLSPILDVSPSVEEAEQEDMFEKQEEERRRRESQEEDDDECEYEHYFKPVEESEDDLSFYGLKRYERVENICQLLEANMPSDPIDVKENCKKHSSPIVTSLKSGTGTNAGSPFVCVSASQPIYSTQSSGVSGDVSAVFTNMSPVSSVCSVVKSPKTSTSLAPIPSSSLSLSSSTASSSTGDSQSSSLYSSPNISDNSAKPVPKPRRKLPEPTAEMIAASSSKSPRQTPASVVPQPSPSFSTAGAASDYTSHASSSGSFVKITLPNKNCERVGLNMNDTNNNNDLNADVVIDKPYVGKTRIPSERAPLQKQDSEEKRRKAKDLKAKPNPLVIKHIESEEQSMSPQYRVLDSPPSPESRSSLRRDYSDSTSVSPSSSPDREVYPFPSPVTPPDSDSSPPKPHSPSSPGTDFDDEAYNGPTKKLPVLHRSFEDKTTAENKVKEKIKKFEQASQEQKKTRRKLPPIPANEESSTASLRHKGQQSNSRKAHVRTENRRKRVGYGGTPSSTSDDSMNEDDFEVAMLTKQRHSNLNNLDKPGSLDKKNGNYIQSDQMDFKYDKSKSKDVFKDEININIPLERCELMRMASIERNDQLLKDKDENDQIIDSLISIYGEPITQAMKTLKRKLQDELRRATEGRRKRIEEFEEIRALQLQIGELKLSTDYAKAQLKRSMQQRQGKSVGQNGKKRGSQQLPASRSSPQVLPRRSRHKRQQSDPMISKFSPIKEDKDVESDFQSKGKPLPAATEAVSGKYNTDESSQSGLSDNESTRSEPANARQKKTKPSAYAKMFYLGNKDEEKTSNTLENTLQSDMKSKYHSESYLVEKSRKKALEDDIKSKENRKQQLQYEIEKRKKQLEETSRLQNELLNLTRGSRGFAHSFDDIPRTSSYGYPPTRPIPTGIIKPLDDDDDDLSDLDRMDDDIKSEMNKQSNYSSSEYLAHKKESRRTVPVRGDELHTAYSSPYLVGAASEGPPPYLMDSRSSPYYKSDGQRDSVISSSVTLPEIYSTNVEPPYLPGRDNFSDTEASPPSDSTPAMPLLGDVKAKSRKIIHEIGTRSRPVSAEYNLGVDDLLNAMHRVESDNSVDADEPIMKHMTEGGVTIHKSKQLERKKQMRPAQRKKYDFEIKRILLTRDPKDRSIKGNGIGMKIVGGKTVPGTNEVGAFVTAIYPGGVADQLHGELREGDQVIEWNGVELTNKSYEEVQSVINQPNGEIELVVRPGTRGKNGDEKSQSCHSSYDNLDFVPDDIYEQCLKSQQGVDPKQLAAQLEGIDEGDSPAGSQSSSQQEFMTPSMSSPCSSTRSDPASTSSDKPERPKASSSALQAAAPKEHYSPEHRSFQERQPQRVPGLMPFPPVSQYSDEVDTMPKLQQDLIDESIVQAKCPQMHSLGDIQLQLNHCDYDNTLNILVLQARNLSSKDINGLSDPFVKIYLLPGRCPENKRRTKHISRTLSPEWNQAFTFNNLHREELQYKTLEVTVWDYDRFKANDFLGEVIIDLSEPGFLDDKPHWYPLREHDQTSGVELPKPTVLPPAPRSMTDRGTGSPSLGVLGRGPSKHSYKGCKSDGNLGSRRRSLGTLTDVDRLTSSDSMELSSTHSSPLLPHKPRDMHIASSAHAPGKVLHCFSGFLSHILSPRTKKSKYSARLSHRLLANPHSKNRSLKETYWKYQSF